jgi:putative membrane protein
MSNDSGSDRAMSGGGGGAPSIPAGGTAAANDGTTAPAGSTGSDTRGAAGGTSGAGTSGGAPGAGSSSAGGSTGGSGSGAATGSPTPPSTPGKSSSLDSTVISAHVVPTADTSVASGELSRADKSFIEEAASGGLTEVEVGKMMAQRATHPGVREFAERLVKDHTQANEELRRIAANYGVSLPATPDAKHRAMVEKLANEKGAELDREFLRTFGVKEHQKDIKDFQKQAQSGDNGELKAFAAKTLPKLQEHQAMAQRLEQELARK